MEFFKRLPHKATPTELSEVHTRLDAQMCGFAQEWALESLGVEKLIPLLNIADNEKLGATKAILYAYRFGYLAGKGETKEEYTPREIENEIDCLNALEEMIWDIPIHEIPGIYKNLKERYFTEESEV